MIQYSRKGGAFVSILDNFVSFNFDEGVPYVSVTSNGITFNKAVVMKLGYPKHVVLLINETMGQMAVQCCAEDTPNAVAFYRPRKNNVVSVRWNGKDLLNTIQAMMAWDLTLQSFRVDGTLLREEDAMLFDLHQAKELK